MFLYKLQALPKDYPKSERYLTYTTIKAIVETVKIMGIKCQVLFSDAEFTEDFVQDFFVEMLVGDA